MAPALSSANTASELVRMTPPSPLHTVFRSLELGDIGTPDDLDAVFSRDLVDHNPSANRPEGISGFESIQNIIERLRTSFSDSVHRVLFYLELPDDWTVVHWEITKRHTGDFMGYAPTGELVTMKGIDIVRVEGDKIVELYHVEDQRAQFEQLEQQRRDAAS